MRILHFFSALLTIVVYKLVKTELIVNDLTNVPCEKLPALVISLNEVPPEIVPPVYSLYVLPFTRPEWVM